MPSTAEPPNTADAKQHVDDVETSLIGELLKRPLLGGIALLLLMVHGVLVYRTASYCTVTHDEYWHIPVGLLNLQYQQFDFDNLNPPLGRMVAAAPLLLVTERVDEAKPIIKTDLWDYGDDFLEQHGDDYHNLIVVARMPGVLLSVLFGFLTAMWATQLFGLRSGFSALTLWTFSPSIIANSALATNDMFVSGLFVVAIWRSSNLRKPGSGWEPLGVGMAIGAACLVKFTGLLLFAVVPVISLVAGRRLQSLATFRATVARLMGAFVVAVAVINFGYFFHGSFTPLNDYSFESASCRAIQSKIAAIANLPVPLPYSFVAGVDHQRAMMEGAHPIYLSGQWQEKGYLSYFFLVFAWKLPHCFQLLMALSAWTWFREWRAGSNGRNSAAKLAILLLPTLLLFFIGSISDMQLGLRYILPSIPLLIVFSSYSITAQHAGRRNLVSIVFWVLIGVSITSVRFHPHHLAYFNELSGGPENGWKLLSDSNIDWGQDLRALNEYLKQHDEVTDLKLAYFGTFPPGQLGIEYTLPTREPKPGWYAISVNIMQGRPNPLRQSDGTVQNVFDDPFGYLRFFDPVARIGESIRVYHVTENDLKRRRIEMRLVRP